MDQSTLVELLGSRKLVYDFLRRIFIEGPTGDVLGLLRRLLDCQGPEGPDDEKIPGLDLIGQAISENKNDEDKTTTGGYDGQLLDNLTREFNRLFAGPGRIPASPYESVYRSPGRLLMQDSTIDVRREYLEAGLVLRRLGSVPDDHLGAELEFMFHLSEKAAAEALNSHWEEAFGYLNQGRVFLKEHLLSWIGDFSEDVLGATEGKFFRGLVTFLKEFLAQDLEFLRELRTNEKLGVSR